MKAKDYFDYYLDLLPTPATEKEKFDLVFKICAKMLTESKDIILNRKCFCDSEILSVYKEIRQKYAAFARILNKYDTTLCLEEDGIDSYVAKMFSDLMLAIKNLGLVLEGETNEKSG